MKTTRTIVNPEGECTTEEVEVADNYFDPQTQTIDPMTQAQLALAELAEVEAAHDLENKLAIAELAEAMTGGVT